MDSETAAVFDFITVMAVIKIIVIIFNIVLCSTEYWAGDDIMDSETAVAFELFMAESQQHKASSSSRTALPASCPSGELTSGHP